jgi:type III secretory pathway component EscS
MTLLLSLFELKMCTKMAPKITWGLQILQDKSLESEHLIPAHEDIESRDKTTHNIARWVLIIANMWLFVASIVILWISQIQNETNFQEQGMNMLLKKTSFYCEFMLSSHEKSFQFLEQCVN